MGRILIVEDEPQLLRAMRINLHSRGHEVRTAVDGGHALREAASHPPDLVVLDLGLPDLDGIDVIRGLRGWTSVPIIVLSGRTSGHDKIAALDAGADDYVTKPFSVEELLARIRAVTRRAGGVETGPVIIIGRHRIDFAAKAVTTLPDPAAPPADGGTPGAAETAGTGAAAAEAGAAEAGQVPEAVRLTPTEWRLLATLVREPGKLISSRSLLDQVWGPGHADDTSSLRLYVNRLRRKLEPDPSRPRHLTTEPGMGYRYQP
ncbi:two component transcriptional regulator, winged helix family [Frankia torreyi]|uniref:Two component transcriptional regulator, winged helix family n=1 Tax=Frankia torreyi TaxID=1856 RepID=A0A0D8B773_9ACTN|nr:MULTISPECIES: response regulator [Frankia]KJE19955.1 two component transcriptional regulator, winged helix family [Frankia torreyi]KQC37460.1 transcriptional regulator [Frankia sp. ACN1ag]KQM02296.1 two component transcriptional regulator, winged helix family [Frankia sp. CpI1-P]